MVFSSYHSLRNHVAEKDHYVRGRPNNNRKVDEAHQAKKRRKERTTFIVDFFNRTKVSRGNSKSKQQGRQMGMQMVHRRMG